METLNDFPWLFPLSAAIIGLLVGSFLNVVILRLPRRMEWEWRAQAREILEIEAAVETIPPDLVVAGSHCPKCGFKLRPWHNVPVFSWIFLRGRCASCKAPISLQYPLVELATALLSAYVAWHFGPTNQALAGIALTWVLIALTGIDARTQLLPDQLTLPLLWTGLILSLIPVFAQPEPAIIGAAVGYLALWLVFQIFKLTTGKEGMGFGDFKLLAALGAWFGWISLLPIVLLSSGVGAIYGILVLLIGRKESGAPMPFGPFIAGAGWIYLLWGEQIVDGYLRMSGLTG